MDDFLSDLEFETGLEGLAARLDAPASKAEFTLPENRFFARKAKARQKRSRRGIKSLIKPENARAILPHLPVEPLERLHCILRGDFVLCDLIPLIIEERGRCDHLRIATLGMSAANATTLASLQARGLLGELTIVVSHYFQQVDKVTTYREVRSILEGRCRFTVTRNHAKVILLPTSGGDHYVIEGSANLRSSDNLEQMLVMNDRETHDFHSGWMESLESHG